MCAFKSLLNTFWLQFGSILGAFWAPTAYQNHPKAPFWDQKSDILVSWAPSWASGLQNWSLGLPRGLILITVG